MEISNMDESQNKEQFYIFLDFDGVLNDLITVPSLWKMGGFLVDKKDTNTFNQGSIDSINYLIETLSQEYDVNLVLSTTWRRWFEKAKQVLKNNGLEYSGVIDKTPKIRLKRRAFEIMKYLQSKDEKQNFVVIDDKPHLPKYFKEKNSIKTNIVAGSLSMSTILNYLDTYFPKLLDKNPPKDYYNFVETNEK